MNATPAGPRLNIRYLFARTPARHGDDAAIAPHLDHERLAARQPRDNGVTQNHEPNRHATVASVSTGMPLTSSNTWNSAIRTAPVEPSLFKPFHRHSGSGPMKRTHWWREYPSK